MESDPYLETWRKYRRARRVFLAMTCVGLGGLVVEWGLGHRDKLLPMWLVVAPLMFWSVWRLESLRCPRCGKKFINLLGRWPDDDYACPSCGLRYGATGDAT